MCVLVGETIQLLLVLLLVLLPFGCHAHVVIISIIAKLDAKMDVDTQEQQKQQKYIRRKYGEGEWGTSKAKVANQSPLVKPKSRISTKRRIKFLNLVPSLFLDQKQQATTGTRTATSNEMGTRGRGRKEGEVEVVVVVVGLGIMGGGRRKKKKIAATPEKHTVKNFKLLDISVD